jgi:hypothetical protein
MRGDGTRIVEVRFAFIHLPFRELLLQEIKGAMVGNNPVLLGAGHGLSMTACRQQLENVHRFETSAVTPSIE